MICGILNTTSPINNRKSYWDNVYLLDAVYWSRKSHDPETQCGCVIVNPLDHTTDISWL